MTEKEERHIFDLAHAVSENQASEDEIQELNDLMRDSAEARQIYLKVMDMHFDLDQMSVLGSLATEKEESCEAILFDLDKRTIEEIDKTKRSKISYLIIGLAALFIISLSLIMQSQSPVKINYTAEVVASINSKLTVGSELRFNELIELKENDKITIRFQDDAEISLKGPVKFTLKQNDSDGKWLQIGNSPKEFPATMALKSSTLKLAINDDHTLNEKSEIKVIETGYAYAVHFEEKEYKLHVFEGKISNKETTVIYISQADIDKFVDSNKSLFVNVAPCHGIFTAHIVKYEIGDGKLVMKKHALDDGNVRESRVVDDGNENIESTEKEYGVDDWVLVS